MAQNRHWEQDKEATVYIGNIDERATSAMVYEIMLQMGPIHNIHMPRDRVTQTHQGFGFVEFRTPTDAEYAANVMNGIKLYGKSLRVNKASADKQRAAEVGAELFIGNLDSMVDEKILYDTFSRFGPLLSLPKVAREESGASKGFGFVSFADFESSDAAIDTLHGQYILSKEVSVQYAFKKDGKGERHGDQAERSLAAEAKKRNIVPEAQPVPQAFLQQPPAAAAPPAGFDPSVMGRMPVGAPPQVAPGGFAPLDEVLRHTTLVFHPWNASPRCRPSTSSTIWSSCATTAITGWIHQPGRFPPGQLPTTIWISCARLPRCSSARLPCASSGRSRCSRSPSTWFHASSRLPTTPWIPSVIAIFTNFTTCYFMQKISSSKLKTR
ncbi:hypothetical protein NXS19_012482 [Fusarium pseudograminearum]|nr:hypothetical protein NXS19_012482 [Fusarium pseudograminearum]